MTVVEAESDCLQQASLRNEGKIHLGFVYAKDASGSTSSLMLEGALAFGPLVETFVGHQLPWDELRSELFTYLVMADSQMTTSDIADFYSTLDRRIADYESPTYLGRPINALWSEVPITSLGGWLNRDFVQGAFRTCEAALDREGINVHLRRALHAHPNITMRYGHRVLEARRTSEGFTLAVRSPDGGSRMIDTDIVVNCLWDQRLLVDSQIGIVPDHKWVHRRKFRILGRMPAELEPMPSLTMVLGSYGDVVVYPHTDAYISWYPTCMTGWSTDVAPPDDWHMSEAQVPSASAELQRIVDDSIVSLSTIVKGLEKFEPMSVASGLIVARGESDIDDPNSELHTRHNIGVNDFDGWFSIDTGKYTTAPLFAQQLADRLASRRT